MRRSRPRSVAGWVPVVVAAAAVLGTARPVGSAALETQSLRYDVFVGERAVGEMRLDVMTIRDITIIEERFTAPMRVKGKSADAGFESEVVYKGTTRPVLSRGKVTTRLGEFKIMTGQVTVTASDGAPEAAAGTGASAGTGTAAQTAPSPAAAAGRLWTVEAEATGYADLEQKPFATARTWKKTLSTRGDVLLTHAAFLLFAPKMLPGPGRVEHVVHVEFPDDIGFPELVNFGPGCVLQRRPAGADGKAEITLHRVFAGGNIVPLLKMTLDGSGKVVEMQLGRFTLRPVGER